MFAALNTPDSVVDRCAEAIQRAILSGKLPVGSRLPPERRLSEDFDVHRGTVRAALARLCEDGLLDVRQGRGYRVLDFRQTSGPRLLGLLAQIAGEEGRLGALVGDLLLIRRQLALLVLERLSERRSWLLSGAGSSAKRAIDDAVAAFSDEVDRGADEVALAEADLAVVAALVAATDSPVFALCMNPILAVLRDLPSLHRAIYREPAANQAGWQLVAAWLEMTDAPEPSVVLAELERRDEATLSSFGAPR